VVGLDWRSYVEADLTILSTSAQSRPTLRGDIRKIESLTGWQPRISFEQMVNSMVQAEMARG